jgi:hypothetical protein
MFTKEYVGFILSPFVGKNIRMNSNKDIPFCLETSMESSFQIQIDNMGIKFVLIDNYYIKRDLLKVFSEAFQEIDIYPFQLDSLSKEKIERKGTETIIFDKIVDYVQKNMTPQIAYTYYGMINSLSVDEKKFTLNGVEFFISSH